MAAKSECRWRGEWFTASQASTVVLAAIGHADGLSTRRAHRGSGAWLIESVRRRRWHGATAAALLLLMWALSQMVVVVLGEGMITMKQHLVATRFALDLLAVIVVFDVAKAAVQRFRAGAPLESAGRE